MRLPLQDVVAAGEQHFGVSEEVDDLVVTLQNVFALETLRKHQQQLFVLDDKCPVVEVEHEVALGGICKRLHFQAAHFKSAVCGESANCRVIDYLNAQLFVDLLIGNVN